MVNSIMRHLCASGSLIPVTQAKSKEQKNYSQKTFDSPLRGNFLGPKRENKRFNSAISLFIMTVESYPSVSNIIMFKSCFLIVEYICIMAGGMIFPFFHVFEWTKVRFKILYDATMEIYPTVSNIIMFKTCFLIVEYICIMAGGMTFQFFIERYPSVSNIIMFKSGSLIVEYICIIAGGMIFTFLQGKSCSCSLIVEYICIIAGGMIFTFLQGFNSAISLFIMTVESYPSVSNIIMFKSCSLIVEYRCIIAGGMIFPFFHGKYCNGFNKDVCNVF
ncbi:hypothetical protein T07_1815 [Trichinella nelsoni]|uniref:Uncharacterized protein n=1 Tax=Trichinella nelsoni TaxID=6336 RepID=A0A0V0S162_9BILA|nr:hypothetical protein T07_1815 [Trichinella nelsoni]